VLEGTGALEQQVTACQAEFQQGFNQHYDCNRIRQYVIGRHSMKARRC